MAIFPMQPSGMWGGSVVQNPAPSAGQQDWSTEIQPPQQQTSQGGMWTQPGTGTNQRMGTAAGTPGTVIGTPAPIPTDGSGLQMTPPQTTNQLNMQHGLPTEVIEAPMNANEVFMGSLKSTLLQNRGSYIVATFLVGNQSTVAWEGILAEVGNDYLTIYQESRERYIVCDLYMLKYMEFYDVRRRNACEEMLRQTGWQEGPGNT